MFEQDKEDVIFTYVCFLFWYYVMKRRLFRVLFKFNSLQNVLTESPVDFFSI